MGSIKVYFSRKGHLIFNEGIYAPNAPLSYATVI